ncbi:glycoside hydrolase family 39, partial [Klebsiella pneumoniae]|nr:glycoside hydrolase family 39 [Klebsiella pneumoniae]
MIIKFLFCFFIISVSLIFQPESQAAQIQDLVGINGYQNASHLEQFNIKWVRIDFSWKCIEM